MPEITEDEQVTLNEFTDAVRRAMLNRCLADAQELNPMPLDASLPELIAEHNRVVTILDQMNLSYRTIHQEIEGTKGVQLPGS